MAQKPYFSVIELAVFKTFPADEVVKKLPSLGWSFGRRDQENGGYIEHWYYSNFEKISAKNASIFLDISYGKHSWHTTKVFYGNRSKEWFKKAKQEMPRYNFRYVTTTKVNENITVHQYSAKSYRAMLLENDGSYYMDISDRPE